MIELGAWRSDPPLIGSLVLSLVALSLVITGTLYLLYRLDLGIGAIRRRIKAFDRVER